MATDLFLHLENKTNAEPDLVKNLKYKLKKNDIIKAYNKLKIMINMKLINSALYIRAAMAKVHIAKAILILELE